MNVELVRTMSHNFMRLNTVRVTLSELIVGDTNRKIINF